MDRVRRRALARVAGAIGLPPPPPPPGPGTPVAWVENPTTPTVITGAWQYMATFINPAAGGIPVVRGMNLRFLNAVSGLSISALITKAIIMTGTVQDDTVQDAFTSGAQGSRSGIAAAAGAYAKIPFAGLFSLDQFTQYWLVLKVSSSADLANVETGATGSTWTRSPNIQGGSAEAGIWVASAPGATYGSGGNPPQSGGFDFQLTSD